MKTERAEQIRKLGKAAERLRILARVKTGQRLFADGIVLLDELDRTRKALADLLELHEDEPSRPAVANALRLLDGTQSEGGGA